VTSIFPPEAGGPATFISALRPGLSRAGHRVRVFSLWDQSPQDRPLWLAGLTRFRPVWLRLALIFVRLLPLVRWADLVYVNGLELPSVLAARLLRRPVILKIVGDYAWERARLRGRTDLDIGAYQQAWLPFRLACQRSLRTVYSRLARTVVTPSRYLKGLVHGWGIPASRIRVIINGLTPWPRDQKPRPAGQEPSEEGLILTAARLVDWKGIDHLIEALALVDRPARLLILGRGQEQERLEALSQEIGLSDRVTFSGEVDRAGVLAAMAEADVFVLASSYEGLPHVLLEAMACGLPVVATRVGGTPEVVEDGRTGLLVPYGKPDELARAVRGVLARPELAAALSQAGQARAAEFAWTRTVAQTADLIAEVLS